ncbi:MAG: hypothetical protein WCJ30_07860, partial [Deltaproteobacteria bacterium]
PVPPASPLAPTADLAGTPSDTAPVRARMQSLESRCRAQPSGTSRSLAAVDAMRTALGSACTIESVDNDPMLWLFRCQTDRFFPLGQYTFPARGAMHACRGVESVRASNDWVCAGAALGQLLAQRGGIEGARVVFVGHVDEVHLSPSNPFEPCRGLVEAFAYQAGREWTPIAPGQTELLDHDGNDHLAWCRAASVAQQVLCGMRASSDPRATRDCETLAFDPARAGGLSLALVGASTMWQQRQPAQVCPACAQPGAAAQCECGQARRVDVLVQFQPHETASSQAACASGGAAGDANGQALYCLQDCLEGRSVLAEEAPIERHELFTDCAGAESTPAGWHEAIEGQPGCTRTHRDLLRRIIGL